MFVGSSLHKTDCDILDLGRSANGSFREPAQKSQTGS